MNILCKNPFMIWAMVLSIWSPMKLRWHQTCESWSNGLHENLRGANLYDRDSGLRRKVWKMQPLQVQHLYCICSIPLPKGGFSVNVALMLLHVFSDFFYGTRLKGWRLQRIRFVYLGRLLVDTHGHPTFDTRSCFPGANPHTSWAKWLCYLPALEVSS